MAYNKAKEEKKWLLWKEAEEKKLREQGMSYEAILELRSFDREVFNSDRKYYQRKCDKGVPHSEQLLETACFEVKSVDELLNSVENPGLYQILADTDISTLQILVMNLSGYSVREISLQLGIKDKAIYERIMRLKNKIKKYYK